MAEMNSVPHFVAKWYTAVGSTTGTASTSRATPTSVVGVVTAASAGTRIDRITCIATVATAAGIIHIWDYDGANYTLVEELLTSAITPGDAVIGARVTVNLSDDPKHSFYVLQTGHALRFSTTQAEVWDVNVHCGDFSA